MKQSRVLLRKTYNNQRGYNGTFCDTAVSPLPHPGYVSGTRGPTIKKEFPQKNLMEMLGLNISLNHDSIVEETASKNILEETVCVPFSD